MRDETAQPEGLAYLLGRLAQSAPQAIWCVDASYARTWANAFFLEHFANEPFSSSDQFKQLYAEALQGHPVLSDEAIEIAGRKRHFAVAVYPLRVDEKVVSVAIMLRETTVQVQLRTANENLQREIELASGEKVRAVIQQQLTVADRLTTVGTLAAGVAHEINNPLAAVMVNLQLAQEDVALLAAKGIEPEAVQHLKEELRDAAAACERVKHIVRDLKTFARNSDRESDGPVNVHQVLELSLRMAANDVRHRAKLVKKFDPVPSVLGNEARLGQVFLNLLLNAVQAIPDGNAFGNTITVTTRTMRTGFVEIEFKDTGCGIAPENLERIFDPFFSTKPTGEGVGLGLSIAHQIVTALGGSITVESAANAGATFVLSLPSTPSIARVAHEPLATAATRRGRVLSIDDEPMVGTFVRRILGPIHEVDTLTSATDALKRVEAGQKWDVILCDVMMPQMTGVDLYWRLNSVAPDLAKKMIFLTAGAFTSTARNFMQQVPNARLEKPFDAQALRALVNLHVGG